GVLDDGVGERLGDRAVQLRIGREIDDRAAVVRLEVDDAHPVELAETPEQPAVPVLLRVELELESGRELEPTLGSGARRDDEADGPLFAAEGLAEAGLGLPEREIEGGALERPAAVALAQLVELVEPVREV